MSFNGFEDGILSEALCYLHLQFKKKYPEEPLPQLSRARNRSLIIIEEGPDRGKLTVSTKDTASIREKSIPDPLIRPVCIKG